jgi:hypothetical protein
MKEMMHDCPTCTHEKKGRKKVEKVMHEYKEGELPIGKSKKKVKSRKQAIAIALSEARKTRKRKK